MYERAKAAPERIPALIEEFHGDLSFKADVEHPEFSYQKKARNGRGKEADSLEIVKNVLIGIKGLIAR